jgi:hypothetical protein
MNPYITYEAHLARCDDLRKQLSAIRLAKEMRASGAAPKAQPRWLPSRLFGRRQSGAIQGSPIRRYRLAAIPGEKSPISHD